MCVSSHYDKVDNGGGDNGNHSPPVNPLAKPLPWWYQLSKRVELFPWWLRYVLGIAEQAVLADKIIELGTNMGLQDKWLRRIIRHAVSEFSKNGLGTCLLYTSPSPRD